MSAKTFRKLSDRVTREYRSKGFSASKAREIGNATAAKISRIKNRKRSH